MQIVTVYPVKPDDTKAIRAALKQAGRKVKRCQLGRNRYYILVHTDDNRAARPVVESLGYVLNPIWETEHDFIFNGDTMKFQRVTR